MEEDTLCIYWTRHAESCSNKGSGNLDDKETVDYNNPQNYGYEKRLNAVSNIENVAKSYTSKLKSTFLYHPNISFIGVQHGINLGLDFVKDKKIDVIFCSPTLRTVMTALTAYRTRNDVKIYIIPYITELVNIADVGYFTQDNQNRPLESKLLKRMVAFIKDWLSEKWPIYYDDIELIRKIHSILELKTDALNELKKECKSVLECRKNSKENVCSANRLSDLYKLYNLLLNSSIKDEFVKLDSKLYNECLNFFKIFENEKIMREFNRGPTVDFSLYEEIENDETKKQKIFRKYTDDYNTTKEIFDIFYELLEEKKILFGNVKNVHCICHGSIMRKIFSNKYKDQFEPAFLSHIYNTQTFLEKIYNKDYANKNGKNVLDCRYYIPMKIRSSFQNFEKYNLDVCNLQSVKGYINFPLWNGNEGAMGSKYTGWGWLSNVKDAVNPDIKEYMDKTEENLTRVKYYGDNYKKNIIEGGCGCKYSNSTIAIGGCGCKYAEKYLHYKKKYLDRKKNI